MTDEQKTALRDKMGEAFYSDVLHLEDELLKLAYERDTVRQELADLRELLEIDTWRQVVAQRDEARAEVERLRRVNHRHLCGCIESGDVLGCGIGCPCRCHALEAKADHWFVQCQKVTTELRKAGAKVESLIRAEIETSLIYAEIESYRATRAPYCAIHQHYKECEHNMSIGSLPWRVGSKVGRTLYDSENRLIGLMDTRELAKKVADAVNACGGRITPWKCECGAVTQGASGEADKCDVCGKARPTGEP
jgi:hypothetical protein